MDIVTYALLNGKVSSVANVLDGLNSGFDYKGSVASAENLPSGASVGDTYTVTDENNEKYTWNGTEWIKTDLKYEGVAEDVDDLKDDVGNLSNLNTVDKSTIVDAVNEVLDNIYGGHYIPSYGDLATISLGTTWSGSGPYTQAVTLTGYNPSASTMVSILPDETVINQMLNDGVGQIYIKNDNGTLSAVAFGGTTTAALTLYVVCAETDTTMSIEELSLKVGDLSQLKTVTKSNLVGAINEIEGGLPEVTSADNGKSLVVENGEWAIDNVKDYSIEKTTEVYFDGDVTMQYNTSGNYYSATTAATGRPLQNDSIDVTLDSETITIPRAVMDDMYFFGEFSGMGPDFTNYPACITCFNEIFGIMTASEYQHIKIEHTEKNVTVLDDFKDVVNAAVDRGYGYETGEPEIVLNEDTQTMVSNEIYYGVFTIQTDPPDYDELYVSLNNGEVVTLPRLYSYMSAWIHAYGEIDESQGLMPDFTNYPVCVMCYPQDEVTGIIVYTQNDFTHVLIKHPTVNLSVSSEFEEAVETVVPKVDLNDYAPVIETEQEHLCGIWLRDGADDYSIKSLEIEFTPRQPGEDDPSSVNVRPLYGLTKYDILVTDFTNHDFKITRSGTGTPSPENPMPIVPALSFEKDDETTERFYKGSFWNDYYESVSGVFAYSTSVHSSKISDGTWSMPATSIFKCQFDDAGTWSSNTDCLRYSSIYETTSMFTNESTLLSSLQNYQIGAVSGQAPLYIKDTRYTDVESFVSNVGDEYVYYPPPSTVYEDESFSIDEGLRVLDAIGYEKYVKHEIDWEQTAGTIYGGKITIDEKGNVTVTKEWDSIASYNNEVLPGVWMSSKDVYTEGTTPTVGAQVAYKLSSPSAIYQFTIDPIKTYYQDNVVEGCGPDTLQLKYRADTAANFKNYVKKTDIAGMNNTGVVRVVSNYGIQILSYGALQINKATDAKVKAGTDEYLPIVPSNQQKAVFYGLAAAAGDTTQKSSNNAVGTYTDTAKTKIMEMLGVATVTITGTDPVIVAEAGKRYICGEIASLTFTPPASGITDVVFTSGTTPTVISLLPADGVKMTETWETPLDASTTYELNFLDRKGVFVKWT